MYCTEFIILRVLRVIFYYTLLDLMVRQVRKEAAAVLRDLASRGMPPGYVHGVLYLEPIPPPRKEDVELAAAGDKAAKMRMANWNRRNMIRNRAIAQQQGRNAAAARRKSPARTPKLRGPPPRDDDGIDMFSGDEDDVYCDDVGVMADGLTSSSSALRYVPMDYRPS